jgi:hypothetical protein
MSIENEVNFEEKECIFDSTERCGICLCTGTISKRLDVLTLPRFPRNLPISGQRFAIDSHKIAFCFCLDWDVWFGFPQRSIGIEKYRERSSQFPRKISVSINLSAKMVCDTGFIVAFQFQIEIPVPRMCPAPPSVLETIIEGHKERRGGDHHWASWSSMAKSRLVE